MQKKRLQNKISESRWLLTFVSPIILAIWIFIGFIDHTAIIPLLCLFFSTYLMLELNNTNALIRIYSRMASCSFLVLTTVAINELTMLPSAIITLCTLGFYTCAFRCYQDEQSQGWIFYAFLCIGLSSLVWVQILYFVPLLWLLIAKNMLALKLKPFISSLFALTLPYIFAFPYTLYIGEPQFLLNHFVALGQFDTFFDYEQMSIPQIITGIFLLLCSLIGSVHYIRQKRNDSIRTRLLYGCFISINSFALIFLILQPQHYACLVGIIIASISPLLGHFFALTRTAVTNFTFKFLSIITIAILAYNLWILLPNFF